MKILKNKLELKNLILNGITQEELDNNYDYSQITNMSFMFENCNNLKEIPLLDTSNVTTMSGMFANCSNLKTIPLIDTKNVINMNKMFENCTNLEEKPELNMEKCNKYNKYNMYKGCIIIDENNEHSKDKKKIKDEKDFINSLNDNKIELPNLII